jgi:translation initiation factor 1
MAKKDKIATDGGQEIGLNPFSSLQLDNLMPGLVPYNSKISNSKKQVNNQKSKGIVKIRREKTGRGGKTVIVVYEIPNHVNQPAREKMLKTLKARLGTGGTLKDRNIEIQGEKLDDVREFLTTEGFQVKG